MIITQQALGLKLNQTISNKCLIIKNNQHDSRNLEPINERAFYSNVKYTRTLVDILNNREIAVVFWLIVISIFFLSSSKMTKIRNSFKRMLAGLFVRQIISVLSLMVTYMVIIIYWLSELDLWNIEQLKNTVFWCISVGFMSLFQLEKFKMDKSFF